MMEDGLASRVFRAGELIVPEDSFLRRLPTVLDRRERMGWDALVYSTDAISANWARMVQLATECGTNLDRITSLRRAGLLSSAWAIVDELDAARQVVRSMVRGKEFGPLTSTFLEACVPVRDLRNDMRHLAEKLGNLAQRTGRSSPLFGALSWFWCPEPFSGEGHLVAIGSGILNGSEELSVLNPAGRAFVPPADFFQLCAFGVELELAYPIEALVRFMRAMEPSLQNNLAQQIKARASVEDHSEEELWAHSGRGLAVAMKIQMTGDDEEGASRA